MNVKDLETGRLIVNAAQYKAIIGTEPATYEGDAEKFIVIYDANRNVLFDVHVDGTATIGGGENTHVINGNPVKSVLEIHSEGGEAPAGLSIHDHGNSASVSSELTFFRSRGTHLSPTGVANGTLVGRISALPFDGNDHNISGQISFKIDGSPGANDSPTSIIFSTAADGQSTTTERARIKPTGEILFSNGGAIPYGNMYGADVASTLTISTAGKGNKVQVTAFAVDGPSSPSITPDHTNDHQTVLVAGDYKIEVSISVDSDTGTAFSGGFSVFKNNGATEIPAAHAHHDFASGGGEETTITLSGIVTLTANDTIEVWGWNETNTTNMVISSISMNIEMKGS